jgi:hypothetical protein
MNEHKWQSLYVKNLLQFGNGPDVAPTSQFCAFMMMLLTVEKFMTWCLINTP